MGRPRKIEVRSFINEGKFTNNRDAIKEAVQQFEGSEIVFSLKRYYKQRTDKENRYYFGVIVVHWKNILLSEWGEVFTKDKVHDFLKENLLFEEKTDEDGVVVMNPVNGRALLKNKSTTENTTYDQEQYHKQCRDLAWEMFNYQIPLPNEKLKVEY